MSKLTEKEKKMLRNTIPKDRYELQYYCKEIFGLNLVDKAVIPGHQSPLDFVSDVFFHKEHSALLIAPRGGGKTISFSALHVLNSRFKPNCESASFGAEKEQARICYDKMVEFLQPFENQDKLLKTVLKESTRWKNGSVVKIKPATYKAANGLHPQIIIGDEIDLTDWDVYQQMVSITTEGHGIPAQDILGSTRKTAWGTIQKILDDNDSGYKVYLYSIWDIMEKCTRKSCDYCKTRIKGKWSNNTPRSFYSVCYDPERDICKAKLGNGFKKIDEVINKFTKTSRSVWEAEWECFKPQRTGTVFYWYNDGSSESSVDYNFKLQRDFKENPVFECIDWGGNDPYVCLWVQRIGNTYYIFDEIYVNQISDASFAKAILKKRQEIGLKSHDILRTYADPSSVSGRIALKENGIQVLKAKNDIMEGINIINSLGEDGRVIVTSNCKNTRREFNSYHYSPNGGDKPQDEDNHTCDAFRYLILTHRGFSSKRDYKPILNSEERIAETRIYKTPSLFDIEEGINFFDMEKF